MLSSEASAVTASRVASVDLEKRDGHTEFAFTNKIVFRIFAPLNTALPTSADAQAFKRWREQLHDPTLIYSRALNNTKNLRLLNKSFNIIK